MPPSGSLTTSPFCLGMGNLPAQFQEMSHSPKCIAAAGELKTKTTAWGSKPYAEALVCVKKQLARLYLHLFFQEAVAGQNRKRFRHVAIESDTAQVYTSYCL